MPLVWSVGGKHGRGRRNAEGLWSVNADGRVVLTTYRFTENGPEALRLQPYGGRLLQFADGVTLRPNSEYFTRHRTFHGFR